MTLLEQVVQDILHKKGVRCHYCGGAPELVTGMQIYPHRKDLYHLRFWNCPTCEAYVGCHQPNERHGLKGTEPFGTLAKASLRRARSQAHKSFDPLWRTGIFKTRQQAYQWLADKLDIPFVRCHIGYFDEGTCLKVEILSEEKRNETSGHTGRN